MCSWLGSFSICSSNQSRKGKRMRFAQGIISYVEFHRIGISPTIHSNRTNSCSDCFCKLQKQSGPVRSQSHGPVRPVYRWRSGGCWYITVFYTSSSTLDGGCMSMAVSGLLIYSGYLFIEVACQWYLLVHSSE
jgi:hypothetical protein